MNAKLFFAFALTGLLFVVACADANSKPVAVNNAATSVAEPTDDAPRISLADAKKDFDAGTAIIVDVRDMSAYKDEHIKGALNIPLAALASSMDKLPKGKKIIAYCSWPNEHSSASWVAEIKKKGYDNVFALLGGTKAWKDAGYPMEQGG